MKTSIPRFSVVLLAAAVLVGCGQTGPLEYNPAQKERVRERDAQRAEQRAAERAARAARLAEEHALECEFAINADARGEAVPEGVTVVPQGDARIIVLADQYVCNPPATEDGNVPENSIDLTE